MPKWWTSLSPLAKALSIIAILIGIALIAIASWQNAQEPSIGRSTSFHARLIFAVLHSAHGLPMTEQ